MKTLVDLLAGGPGSGCHGPRCGRPRGIKQSFTTSQGFQYTLLQPSRKGIKKGSHKWSKGSDQFKGKYSKTAENVKPLPVVAGYKKGRAGVYDAAWGKGDAWEGHGKTIFVFHNLDKMRVKVMEVPHDEMNKSAVARSFQFANFGKAAAFLNARYGIRQALPKPS